MKHICLVIAFALLALPTPLIRAQNSAQPAARKPVETAAQALLENWNDIGRKLIAMAEDFPEDKYDFKPNPAQRSFAENLLHAAGANYYFINAITGQKQPTGDPSRQEYKTKAQVVDYVKKSFSEAANLIKQHGDKGLDDPILDPFGSGAQYRLADMAWGFVEHSAEHYGQLVVYYRVAGLVPPESRPKK